MIMALQMQQAMHDQMCIVRGEGLALGERFPFDDRDAQHQVPLQQPVCTTIAETENIGGVILTAELAVESAAFS